MNKDLPPLTQLRFSFIVRWMRDEVHFDINTFTEPVEAVRFFRSVNRSLRPAIYFSTSATFPGDIPYSHNVPISEETLDRLLDGGGDLADIKKQAIEDLVYAKEHTIKALGPGLIKAL